MSLSGDQRLSHRTAFTARQVDPSTDQANAPPDGTGGQDQFLEFHPESREGWEIHRMEGTVSVVLTDAADDPTEGRELYVEISERDEAVPEFDQLTGHGGGDGRIEEEGTGVLASFVSSGYMAQTGTSATPPSPFTELSFEWTPEGGVYRLEHPAELNVHVYDIGRGDFASIGNDHLMATASVAFDPYTL